MLDLVGIPDASKRVNDFPHQFSGGMRQRVMIAMSLINNPSLLIADEPTTALDVTVQSQILQLIKDLQKEFNMAVIMITHDLGVVAEVADRVCVMYAGKIVETGGIDDIFYQSVHPYTRGLLEAVPRASTRAFKPRAIAGDAVEPWDWPAGCPFAPRCAHHTNECDTQMPPATSESGGRLVRCFNLKQSLANPVPLEPLARKVETSEDGLPTVLTVTGLHANYGRSRVRRGKAVVDVVDDISFTVKKGACLAIVGESGSGKSTTLRCIAGLHEPSAGAITFSDEVVAGRARARHGEIRRLIQIVPQNPDSSLNPRRTVGDIIERPLALYGRVPRDQRQARVLELLDQVHLRPAMAMRYASELSGGEKQRVAIARALAAEPSLLLCDEVVSALDVAVQAGILELLDELRTNLGMTLVFVTHDLGVVRSIASEVVVMKDGRVRETGKTRQIFEDAVDPYTQELLSAIPHLRPTDYPGAPE